MHSKWWCKKCDKVSLHEKNIKGNNMKLKCVECYHKSKWKIENKEPVWGGISCEKK